MSSFIIRGSIVYITTMYIATRHWLGDLPSFGPRASLPHSWTAPSLLGAGERANVLPLTGSGDDGAVRAGDVAYQGYSNHILRMTYGRHPAVRDGIRRWGRSGDRNGGYSRDGLDGLRGHGNWYIDLVRRMMSCLTSYR